MLKLGDGVGGDQALEWVRQALQLVSRSEQSGGGVASE
jgi:hypothetical protein